MDRLPARADVAVLARAALLGTLVVGVVAIVLHGVPFDVVRDAGVRLQAWAQAHRVAAPLAVWAVYTAAAGMTLPVNIPFALLAGALFGFVEGSAVVSFASACGATLSFLSSRWLFRDVVRRRLGDRLQRVEAGIARDGMTFLLMLRLVPAVPYTVTNLVYGLTATPVWRFHLVGQLGMLPASMIYVEAGTRLDRLSGPGDLLSPGLIAALLLLAALPLSMRLLVRRMMRIRRGY